ncbi:MAG: hypothetical protein JWR77_485 [Rhizorhabdus sp.]|nr:hypothetical protein [Rhizorhabdus sp.]
MHFLKTLFWVIVAVIVMAFAHGNWTEVSINLWAGLVLRTKLPVIVVGSVLLGFVPPYVMLRATRWRMKRRIDNIERNNAVLKADLPSEPGFSTAEPSATPQIIPET